MNHKNSRFRRAICLALSLIVSSQPLLAAEYQYQVAYAPGGLSADEAKLQAFPTSHNFGSLAEGSAAGTTITLTNMSTTAVSPTAISVDAPFAQTNNCPAILASRQTCQVLVRYEAQSPGGHSAALRVSTQEGASVAVPLSGTTIAANAGLSLSTNDLGFSPTAVGTAATSQEVVLTNTGNVPTTLSGVGVTQGVSDFNQSNNCGSTLAAGGSCRIFVSFVPSQFGVRTGNLSLFASATGQLYSVALQGTGIAPVLQALPSAVTMPAAVVGASSHASLTLSNAGNATLQGLSAELSGSPELSYTAGTCTTSLAPGASCTLQLTHTPQAAGSANGTLVLSAVNAPSVNVAITTTGQAQHPELTANPAQLTFDDTDVGPAGQQRSVVLSNTGNVPVTLTGLSVVEGGAEFTQANDCGTELALGASCSVQFTFKPSQFGPRSGSAVVVYSGQMLPISLSGNGVQGSLKLSSNDVDFGAVSVGQTSPARTLTLLNEGNAALELSTFGVPGGDFSVDRTQCGSSLPAQGSCTVSVTFSPSAAATRSASFSVSTPANTVSASLRGTGVQGVAALSPSSLTFGATQVGSTSTPQTLTLSNTGSAPLNVSSVAFSTGASHFSQQSNCSQIAVGASCDIQVTFNPNSSGSLTGSLLVAHDGIGATTASVQGTAAAPAASLTTPNFTGVAVGSSTTATAVLTNTGIGTISVTAPAAGSVSGADFSFVSTTCGTSLSQGASCSTTVRFTANNAGVAAGSLLINTSAGAQSAPLNATGLQGTASFSPSSVTFPTTQVAATATQQVVLNNTGTAPLVVSNATTGGNDFFVNHSCTTIGAGASCPLTVSFTPSTTGSANGTLTVSHNGNGLSTIALSGVGQAPSATLSTPSFSATKVGSTSTADATLTNTGLAAIGVTLPNATAVSAMTDYSFVSTTCTNSLAPQASCQVRVRFAPTSTSPASGYLTVFTQAGSHNVPLATSAIQGVASASPGALAFGSVQTNSTSAVQTVTVTNTGNAELVFSGVGMASGSSDFNQSNNCATVAVGATCSIQVTFTPSTTGPRDGTVAMTHDGGGVAIISLSGNGQAPGASLSSPSFAATQAGGSSTATAVLTNTGIGPVTLTVPSSANVTGSAFSFVSTTCSTSLAAGATCSTMLRFSPAAAESSAGTFTLVTANAGTKSVNLAGTGLQGNVTATPTGLTFTSQQIGTTSSSQSITLTNNGTSAVTFSGIGMVSGSTDFAQSNNCATLAVNGSCTVTVTFTPSQAGALSGQVGLSHNGTGVTVLNVSGNGQSASASLSAPSFPATPVGSSRTATATLTNTGVGPLSVTLPATIAAGSSADFTYDGTATDCTGTLAPGANCRLGVRFTPTTAQFERTGALVVQTGAGTQSVNFGTTGIQGFASVNPSSLTYATQQVSSTSASQTVTVTNTGTNTLTFTGVGISAGNTDFGQSNNCASVPVNGSCVVYVTFTPSTTGTRNGTLSLTHNGGGVANVSLTGTGQAPSATLSSPNFATTTIGSSNVADATLSNTGIGTITFGTPDALALSGADYSFVSTTCTTQLTAGANCKVTLRYSPTSTAVRSGTLALSTSAGAKTANFSNTAAGVDYSANLSAYGNAQVAIASNGAWNTSMGQWYSVNAGGTTSVQTTTVGVGKVVNLAGNTPITARLRALTDGTANNLRVNGASVTWASGPNYATRQDSNTFTLYPGKNSITTDVVLDGGPGGWVFQVITADGSAQVSDPSGWRYNGPALPIIFVSNGSSLYYADGTTAASCRMYRFPATGYSAGTSSGYYLANMGAGAEQVYCDQTTDGGGYTLIARSVSGGSATGNFGWYGGTGSVANTSAPYSMNVMSRNLAFTETLFGSSNGGNGWGSYIYKHIWGRAAVSTYTTSSPGLGSPYPISGSSSGGFGMAQCMGMTTASVSSYFFRDMCAAPDSYGLWAGGWSTAYGSGPNDVAGQPVGASYGGYLNGNPNGLIMVR